MRHRLIVLEHGKLLASDALNGCAHGFVFDELASFVLEEVLHVDRTGGAVGNIAGVLGNKRQVAVVLTVAISHVSNNVFAGEIESVTSSIDGAFFVTLNLPTEEYLTLGSGGHAIGHYGSDVVNDVIGVGINNLARTVAQIIFHTQRSLFAANLDELKLYARTAEIIAVGVLNGVNTIVVSDSGENNRHVPIMPTPIPVSL